MDTIPNPPQVKQGALIGGWVCFALGMLIMYWSMWLFIIYGPLFLVAFILSISALSQRRIIGGIALLLLTLTAPLVTWLALGVTRTGAVINKASDYIEAENRKHGFVAPQIGPNGQFIPGHLVTPAQSTSTQSTPAKSTSVPDWYTTNPSPSPTPWHAPPVPASVFSSSPSTGESPTPASVESQGTPAPNQDTELTARDYQQDIASASAATIQITHSASFPPCRAFQATRISFSPDARAILYITSGGQNYDDQIVAYSFVTGERLRSFPYSNAAGNTQMLAWSADGKRAAVLNSNGQFTILDFEADRRVDLPPIQLPPFLGRLLWRTDDELLLVCASELDALNLDSLTVSLKRRYSPGGTNESNVRAVVTEPFKPARTSIGTRIIAQRTAFLAIGDALPITATPVPYLNLLIPDFNQAFMVTPDSHCILINDPEALKVSYLGLRAAPRRDYWLALDNSKVLTPEEDQNRKRSLQTKKIIVGSVYGSQTNPLNGKPIGPNRDLYKGQVAISRWHDDYVDITTQIEMVNFRPGDVVADLESKGEGFAGYSFSYGQQVWKPLMFEPHGTDEPSTSQTAQDSLPPSVGNAKPEQIISTPKPGMIRVPNVTVETATSEFPVSIMAEGPGYLDFNDPRIDEFHVRHRVSLEYFHAHYHDFITIDHYRVRDGKNDPPNANLPALTKIDGPVLQNTKTESSWQRPGTTEAANRDSADAELNNVYKHLMANLAPQQQAKLREDERAWIKWRDTEAARIAHSSSEGGSAYRVDYLNAMTDLIQKRTLILKSYQR